MPLIKGQVLMLKGIGLFIILVSAILTIAGQNLSDEPELNMLVQIPATGVENQSTSGTCWSFAALSFIEAELLRKTGKYNNFSEMYVVRNAYVAKAKKYVRMHGKINFAGGGEANDVFDVIASNGIVDEQVYSGLVQGAESHSHTEMDLALKSYMDSVIVNFNKDSMGWLQGFNMLLNKYLGELPQSLDLEVKSFESIGVKNDDYVYLTSFTHHPFYENFILEVPDNWSWHLYYNIPVNELRQVVDTALYKGYSVVWAADYSEAGFLFNEGLAVVPEMFYPEYSNEENALKNSPEEEIKAFVTDLTQPIDEIFVSQELRQQGFDNYETTDDHLMHIVGKVQGPGNKQYFYVKNSWGEKGRFDGYFLVTESYFDYKTISIMLHKSALPENLKKSVF